MRGALQGRREGLGLESSRDCTRGRAPAAISPQLPARSPRGGRRKRETRPLPPFVSSLRGWILFFVVWGFFFKSSHSVVPSGAPASSRLLLVAVTRQTFLVVTAGPVELGSATGMVFKKRASRTAATLNSSAA